MSYNNGPMPQNFQRQQYPQGAPTGPASHMHNGPTPVVLPQNHVVVKGSTRVLCVADVRGDLLSLNDLATKANADYIIHTGDFGFYDVNSLEHIADKTLKHVAQYSPLLTENIKKIIQSNLAGQPIKTKLQNENAQLSQLPKFLSKEYAFNVPVYTVWGACEDVRVLEKFRSGEYKVDKLHIIDETSSRLLDIGNVKLRILGLGGAVVMHKMFDNGEGKTTIAGGQGTMWTSLLQIGELIDTANRVYDPSETRIFVTHSSPAREGILNQLSVALKADFSISAGLHFRYGSSYNEFSVNPNLDHYRGKQAASKASFNDVWETVKAEVMATVAQNPQQQTLLQNALDLIERMPGNANGPTPFGGPGKGDVDESAFKNMWNFNLADAAFGFLVLDVEAGRIGMEMKSQGFNFAHRANKSALPSAAPAAAVSPSVQTPPGPKPAPIASLPTAAAPPATPSQPIPPPKLDSIKPATPLPGTLNGARSGTPTGPKQAVATTPKPLVAAPAEPKTPVAAPAEPVNKEVAQNGTANAATAEPVGKPATPPPSVQPLAVENDLLYLMNVGSVEAAREVFSPADRELIESVEEKLSGSSKKPYYYIHFASTEIAKAVYGRLPEQVTTFNSQRREAPHVKPFKAPAHGDGIRGGRGGERPGGRGRGSRGPDRTAGDWHARSSASESEGPPGPRGPDTRGDRSDRPRGAFRGDRGDRPRGNYESRGSRARGGRGGGRGGSEGGAGASSAPPAAAPAPAAAS